VIFSDVLQGMQSNNSQDVLEVWKTVQMQFQEKHVLMNVADIEIIDIQVDSRKVQKGSLFLCVQGSVTSGVQYIQDAIDKQATIVLVDEMLVRDLGQIKENDTVILHVPNLKAYMPQLLSVFYKSPGRDFLKVGITGTNGKTTIAQMCTHLLSYYDYTVLSLGTIENKIVSKDKEESSPATLTTPGPVEFMECLYLGQKKNCNALVMEVSSHALSQDRVQGVQYDRTLFTNLTQDHLDYHSSMEEYFAAKKKLFSHYQKKEGVAIVNIVSEYGKRLVRDIPNLNTLTYSTDKEHADLTLVSHSLSLEKTCFSVQYQSKEYVFESSLVGAINLENLLAVVAFGFSLGLKSNIIAEAIRSIQVPGRNEKMVLQNQAVAIVDYAHTPDALKRVIDSIRDLVSQKVICVFGCGGDRDKGKRKQMGTIASSLCDQIWITNDNPRTEAPMQIIDHILEGVDSSQKEKVFVCTDREKAIQEALSMSQKGDCILVAGKGHEDYQIIGTEKHYFDDREVIRTWNQQNVVIDAKLDKGESWN
jgi:UDP-N-acetylmuramyl-tripeptide synthetase